MLQFITDNQSTRPIQEQVKEVIAAGCKWIQLDARALTDDQTREIVAEIKPSCDENDVMLILEGKVHLATELAVAGVHLNREDVMPSKARTMCGPAAVVGVTVHNYDDIERLQGLDVDYITLSPYRSDEADAEFAANKAPLGLDGVIQICYAMRENGIELATVVEGGVTPDDVMALLEAGANGVAASSAIANASDMRKATQDFIQQLPTGE